MIEKRWLNELCVVAATGPSLTTDVADLCLEVDCRIIAVNDAYRLFPFADVLYAADVTWWDAHEGAKNFQGEKWSICFEHDNYMREQKLARAEKYGLKTVRGRCKEGFSLDDGFIHDGANSGYQAINLALLFGSNPVILVGFDMRRNVNGKQHFFGDHPKPLCNESKYETFVPFFNRAAELLPQQIRIINATPGSTIKCFESMLLDEALRC